MILARSSRRGRYPVSPPIFLDQRLKEGYPDRMVDPQSVVNALQGGPPQAQGAPAAPPQDQGGKPVGLALNAQGVPFQCGTCKYFANGACQNPDPRLNGKPVQPVMCCNFYDHPGMQTLIP